MGETSWNDPHGADEDEAAFKRLADGLAALRRETNRLRDTTAAATAPFIDQQAVAAALADTNRRIDTLASRSAPAEARTDTAPILAALAVVEEKLGTLTAGLERYAERNALAEGLAKQDAKLDALAARLDARLNRLQELRPAGAMPVARSRGYYLGLAVLVLLLIGAAGAIVLLRPDLVNERVRLELVEPARDAVKRWMRISQADTPPATNAFAPAAPAEILAASPRAIGTPSPRAIGTPSPPAIGMTSPEVEAKLDGVQPSAVNPEQATSAETPVPVVAELPVATPAEPAPAAIEERAAVDSSVAELPPIPPAPQIVLGAKSDAWLLVRGEDGHTLLARILHEGETWAVPDKPGLRLTTGNATATILKVNGTAVPILGGTGNVRRDIPLDARLLVAEKPAATASR
jgi:hypothetical protein